MLAQSGTSGTGQVLLWIGVLIIVTIGGGLIVLAVRRRMTGNTDELDAAGSLMERLRAMRDRGEISPAEFEQTRAALRARMKQQLSSPVSPADNPRSRP